MKKYEVCVTRRQFAVTEVEAETEEEAIELVRGKVWDDDFLEWELDDVVLVEGGDHEELEDEREAS